MAKTRGRVLHSGAGRWRVRVLGKAAPIGLQMRHKGTDHHAETDVVLENRGYGWKRAHLTLHKGKHLDDVKVKCSVLSYAGSFHNIYTLMKA